MFYQLFLRISSLINEAVESYNRIFYNVFEYVRTVPYDFESINGTLYP